MAGQDPTRSGSDASIPKTGNDVEIIYRALLIRDVLGHEIIVAARDISQMHRTQAAGLEVILMPPVVNGTTPRPGH